MTKLLATDLILAPRDGDPTTIIGKLDSPDAKDRAYIQAMVHWCAVAGIDPFIALTQWLVETSNGESVRWNNDLNPGGVGIPADSTVQPFKIKDGDEAARIHAQALYAAVTRELHDRIPLPEASVEFFTEIWLPKVNHPNYPGVTTVDDLNTRYTANGDQHATWAWDSAYVSTLISRCSAFYPDLKEQSSFTTPVEPPVGGTTVPETRGQVPQPAFLAHYSARENAVAGQNCSEIERNIKGSDHHTEVGSFLGTASWFDNPNNGALTDFQIGGPWDGIYDGVIMRFIEANMPVAPYANGPVGKVRPPFGAVKAFLDKYGYGPTGERINSDLRSIELSDAGSPNRDREMRGRQVESLIFATAYIHSEEAGQSWQEFANQCQHYESGTDHVDCPGAWLKANRAEVTARIVAVMKAYQTNTKLARPLLITYPPNWTGGVIPQPGEGSDIPNVPVYAPPVTYPWLGPEIAADGRRHKVGHTWILPLTMTFEAVKATPRYQRGSKDSALVGPPIAKGTRFRANYVFRSEDGVSFVLTPHGTRIRAAALEPRIAITTTNRISIRYLGEPEPDVISDNVEATAA